MAVAKVTCDTSGHHLPSLFSSWLVVSDKSLLFSGVQSEISTTCGIDSLSGQMGFWTGLITCQIEQRLMLRFCEQWCSDLHRNICFVVLISLSTLLWQVETHSWYSTTTFFAAEWYGFIARMCSRWVVWAHSSFQSCTYCIHVPHTRPST